MPPPSMHGTVMTDEPPLRWGSAKLGRKHCSQDEALGNRASEPPADLGGEMDLLEEITEEGIRFSFSYSRTGYEREYST